jgi:hypothetical protein
LCEPEREHILLNTEQNKNLQKILTSKARSKVNIFDNRGVD